MNMRANVTQIYKKVKKYKLFNLAQYRIILSIFCYVGDRKYYLIIKLIFSSLIELVTKCLLKNVKSDNFLYHRRKKNI